MIQMGTILNVADNSGAKAVRCIKVLGGSIRKRAYIGDTVVASIIEAIPSGKVKRGDMCRCVVVRTSMPVRRKDGSYIVFDKNAVVLINNQALPVGSRVFGPVTQELRSKGYLRIISLAPEVL